MRISRFLIIIGVLGVASWAFAGTARPVTMETLLAEMTSMKDLSEFPDPAYTCKQFSSYDRKSKTPDDREDSWFANSDWGQFIRVEERDGQKEHVLLDADGPGAIVRIWSANPKGILRIYIDGAEKPAFESQLETMLGGKMAGFPAPIACEVSKGWNSYLPIPYAKHCKITSSDGSYYYHVNYRTYTKGTEVVSFTSDQLDTYASAIDAVAKKLSSPRDGGGPPADRDKKLYDLSVEPGKTVVVSELTGPRTICGFLANLTAKDSMQALRHVLVRMAFDGRQTVEVPLGDFFGSAPGVNIYDSLPLGMTKDGDMWSHWYMPFSKTAKIEFVNLGGQPVKIKGGVSTVPYTWTDRSMYFHAGWRSQLDVPTRPMQDWNYLTAKGKGVFAGVAFHIANPVRDWWGEGDEKIYVDGETFPSHFGTGTEDYFGYAWCWPGLFVHAYHNQTRCDGPRNYGHTSVNRWHIIDRIPFTKDFKFDMEIWHWHQTCKVDLAVTAYWYAQSGGTSAFAPIQKADLTLNLLPRSRGMLEGESLRVIEKTGEADSQAVAGTSAGHHLWWRGGKVGDKLTVGFHVDQAGTYLVEIRSVKAPDYAAVRYSVNGALAGNPVDLYHDTVFVGEEYDLGAIDLKEGENTFTIEIKGKNEKAKDGYMVGIDYIRPVRVK